LQKLNGITKLQKLKGRRNTKIIAETDEKPNFAEAEDKISLQKIFKKNHKNYTSHIRT
jgi:inorganic pyrophosphatase